jgi:Zn-dependent protease with chaperone function
MGLFGRRITMTIGLPLLIVLDERAVRAIIAHEVAHAALRHTSGSDNLSEFIAAAANIFEYADPDRTITGRAAAVLLRALLQWLRHEYLILSRADELAADRQGAEGVGSHDMARALVLVAGMTPRIGELVFAPLEKECLGAIRVPTPPIQRIISQLDRIRMPDGIEAAARTLMASEKEDPDATHPSLRRRLANLGFAEIPTCDAVQTSAALSLMPHHVFKALVAKLDGQWSRASAARVDISYR